MEAIIRLNEIDYNYDTSQESVAVSSVSLDIYEGEFIAVLGHNGSGKSTLAKLMNALYIPTKGKVTVCGYDTSDDDSVFDIRQRCGMVFQNPDNQMVATIVEEDIAFGLENLGIEPLEIRKRVDSVLDAVRMGKFSDTSPNMLSGGQKQRIAIAGVLAMQPKIIVLDEPTAMLDPVGRVEVIETVKKMNEQLGITIVLITHFMEEAALADRIVVMDEGRIVNIGTPREVFSKVDELKSIGLDVPMATELAHEIRSLGFDLPKDIINDEELVEAVCRLL
ncbi:MAG: energy-coupling factor transporter ATPase [Clostridiales bacterium]|nr:energy-coupling factor transporter ATPase [Clostridiales bacterium]MBQ2818685.1 energy-coupling factor transporter ATPase [Clostridia bacterium]MBQ4637387.1 energy-coupling factor transporter ATPase [Clostridia bacterium]